MKEGKKILFIVNGLGLGNSTRCDSIIQPLVKRGCIIDVLTSGNGVQYFRECPYVPNIHELRSLYYGSKGGKLSVWKTLLAIPDFFKIFISNIKFVKNLIGQNGYRAVVIDSDYTLLWLKRSLRIPIIALNNADIVIQECRKLPSLPRSIRMQYLIEKCDGWFHRKVPHLVLSPALLPQNDNGGPVKHFAPFIREGFQPRPFSPELKRILVMLSGSKFGSSTHFLEPLTRQQEIKIDVIGRAGVSQGSITYHGKTFSNKHLVDQADMMVINGGFSAVSEAVVLRKPVIVIPVENHAEQFINARIVEQAGLGLVATEENAMDKIREMISCFPRFVQAHRQFECRLDGAQEAAKLIDAVAGS
ncbi:MAG: hypothetical protein HYU99_06005 [Deltaproteobacteria bacterium]|nr:hypothetical protein [Deltaproteobacteria bacterium]